MSMVFAEILVAIFLLFAGDYLFFNIERGKMGLFVRFSLRGILTIAAPVIILLHSVDGIFPRVIALLAMALLLIFSGKYMRLFAHERNRQMLLDLPFFDLEKNLFLSSFFVVVFYWLVAGYFIFNVYR
ncbi:hypothetical protein [Acidovorax sp. Q11]